MRNQKDTFMEVVLPRVKTDVQERNTDKVDEATPISTTPFSSSVKTNEPALSAYLMEEQNIKA